MTWGAQARPIVRSNANETIYSGVNTAAAPVTQGSTFVGFTAAITSLIWVNPPAAMITIGAMMRTPMIRMSPWIRVVQATA